MNEYRIKDIHLDMTESFTETITEDMMELFRKISKDDNPLHTSSEYAVSRNFKGKVAYGLLTSAFYSTLAGMYLPGKYCLLQGIDISFNKPAFAGDVLTISGRVSYINDAYRLIEIKGLIENQHGQIISKSKIKAGVIDG
jgi:3-hydroxybutyryl-CoA dehydratase